MKNQHANPPLLLISNLPNLVLHTRAIPREARNRILPEPVVVARDPLVLGDEYSVHLRCAGELQYRVLDAADGEH